MSNKMNPGSFEGIVASLMNKIEKDLKNSETFNNISDGVIMK